VSRSGQGRNVYRLVSITSHVRIGAEATPLLRKSAVSGWKVRIRCGGQAWYAAAAGLTDVPEAPRRGQAASGVASCPWPCVCASARQRSHTGDDAPGGMGCARSTCRTPPLTGERWRRGLPPRVPNFPEQRGLFPEQWRSEWQGWAALIRKFRSKTVRDNSDPRPARPFTQSDNAQANGRLQRWPMDRHRCGQPPALRKGRGPSTPRP
jgi:hypothetical protein